MPSLLQLTDLAPTVTIFPLMLLAGQDPATVAAALDGRIEELVSVDPRKGEARRGLISHDRLVVQVSDDWHFAGAVYQLEQAPSWLVRLKAEDDPRAAVTGTFRQFNWHLALVGFKRRDADSAWVVVHATQETIALVLREWLVAGRFGTVRVGAPVATAFTNEALQSVGLEGAARQTALTGVHRSTSTKADRKTLLGLDLRDAVDPFGDQSYRLTSAVSKSDTRIPDLLGLSLTAQRLWSSRKPTFGQFTTVLDNICDRLEAAEKLPPALALAAKAGLDQPGYKSLARPESPKEITQALGAFDAAFRPATDLEPADDAGEGWNAKLEQHELRWFADGEVTLFAGNPANAGFVLRVAKAGRHLLNLAVNPTPDEAAVALVATTSYAAGVLPDDPSIELFEQLIEGDGLAQHLAVWYDTGHVLVHGQISTLHYQDVLFDGWDWRSFSIAGIDYDVDEEKPMKPSGKPNRRVADLDAIGTARSLFDYSLVDIPVMMGSPANLWAICDDGAGEVADFVFFDPDGKKLWLVHAKGANSAATGREISASAYEQVASQARKNLRYLDAPKLAGELRARNAGLPRLWFNGTAIAPADHAASLQTLCTALESIIFYEEKCMVILQPHVQKGSWDDARAKLSAGQFDTKAVKSYRLLSALLADLQMTAQKIGSKLVVIGAN